MVQDAIGRVCPFCELDPVYNKVVVQDEFFSAWQSSAPENNTKRHFIIAPRRHVRSVMELTRDEKLSLFQIMQKLQDTYGYKSCGVLIRDGDARLSAGTIEHLHIHVMVPDGTGRVESPFYKGAEDDVACMNRAIIFEKMRLGQPFERLNPEEQALVKDRLK